MKFEVNFLFADPIDIRSESKTSSFLWTGGWILTKALEGKLVAFEMWPHSVRNTEVPT